jgi:hypothetical protein
MPPKPAGKWRGGRRDRRLKRFFEELMLRRKIFGDPSLKEIRRRMLGTNEERRLLTEKEAEIEELKARKTRTFPIARKKSSVKLLHGDRISLIIVNRQIGGMLIPRKAPDRLVEQGHFGPGEKVASVSIRSDNARVIINVLNFIISPENIAELKKRGYSGLVAETMNLAIARFMKRKGATEHVLEYNQDTTADVIFMLHVAHNSLRDRTRKYESKRARYLFFRFGELEQ